MPNLPPLSIPSDAVAKAEEKAKDVDFYADLTDEERADEGLPPRPGKEPESKKDEKEEPEKEAEKKEEVEKTPEPKKPDAGDEAVDDDDEQTQRLFEEIAGLHEKIDASLGKTEPAKTEKEVDARLKAALESEDETTQYLAQQLQQAVERFERIETEAREQRVAAQLARDDAEFDAVQAAYLIDGVPMTDKQVEQVEDFILKNPAVGASLSIEQLTRAVFPGASRRKSPPAKGPGDKPKDDGTPVATIVDQGSSGGPPIGKFTPRPNESIESAIAEAGRRFGWKR